MQSDFVAGNLALDFAATVAERHSTRLEHLRAPEDLAAWIAAAGILDGRLTPTARDLEDAKAMREALFAVIAAIADGRPLPRGALRAVNAAAAVPPPVLRATTGGAVRREGDLAAALSAIARSGLELLALPDGEALQWCADEHCTRAFVDRSRGHRRRWCGMAGCGDRAKAAAYRRRRRAAAAQP